MPRRLIRWSKKTKELAKELTPVQLRYCMAKAEGQNNVEAYRFATGDHEKSGILARKVGSAKIRSPRVQRFVASWQEDLMTGGALSYLERREILAGIARDESESADTRIRAIIADAKLSGEMDGPRDANQEEQELERLADKIRPTLDLPYRNPSSADHEQEIIVDATATSAD